MLPFFATESNVSASDALHRLLAATALTMRGQRGRYGGLHDAADRAAAQSCKA
jgi:hypothetical protein